MNIWRSYKKERGCLVLFLFLLAACWPSACVSDINVFQGSVATVCLQCFDAVGWAAGRAPGL